jgi:hypothetical protein
MVGFYPPLPNTIQTLLYFADYALEEYEPILDENSCVGKVVSIYENTPHCQHSVLHFSFALYPRAVHAKRNR